MNQRERGGILPLVAIGMVSLIGMAGFAIDSSHLFLNSSRLQNALDAAALSAARTLHSPGGDIARATADGSETFNAYLAGELNANAVEVSFSYSESLDGFGTSGGAESQFVRASVTNFERPLSFSRVLPGVGNTVSLASSAVAGPIPLSNGSEVCDIAPILICAINSGDTNAGDGTLHGLAFGEGASKTCVRNRHDISKEVEADGSSAGLWSADCGPEPEADDTSGAGEFHLLSLACGDGDACVQQSLAGEYPSCLTDSSIVSTQEMRSVDAISQGLNTRLGEHSGSVNRSEHPADFITAEPISFDAYETAYRSQSGIVAGGVENRRVLTVAIGDCSNPATPAPDIPVLATGCLFLTQRVENNAEQNLIRGQFVKDCESGGAPSASPVVSGDWTGPQKIILYNDPDNVAS